MKKLICYALACLLLFGIAGCAQTTEQTDSSADPTDSTPVSQTVSEPDESGESDSVISSMTLEECFAHFNEFRLLQSSAYEVIEGYLCDRSDQIKLFARDESVALPDQLLQNSMDDYRNYCITKLSDEALEENGRDLEKVSMTVSVSCINDGQKGYSDFNLEFVYDHEQNRYQNWRLISFDVKEGSKPEGGDSLEPKNSMTMREFLSSAQCLELQSAAFNFAGAYYRADKEEQLKILADPSLANTNNSPWGSDSMDDYGNYAIDGISFSAEESNGETVLKASIDLYIVCGVEGYENARTLCLDMIYGNNEWKVQDLVFEA